METNEAFRAKALYEEFARLYPGVQNPTDINRPEKAIFLIMKGYEALAMMQRARKAGYPWTKLPKGGQ